MNNSTMENLLKETQETIAKFIDSKDVTVGIRGCFFEVRTYFGVMFAYDFKNGNVIEGQAHKVGFTPTKLYDFRKAINQSVEHGIQQN